MPFDLAKNSWIKGQQRHVRIERAERTLNTHKSSNLSGNVLVELTPIFVLTHIQIAGHRNAAAWIKS